MIFAGSGPLRMNLIVVKNEHPIYINLPHNQQDKPSGSLLKHMRVQSISRDLLCVSAFQVLVRGMERPLPAEQQQEESTHRHRPHVVSSAVFGAFLLKPLAI